MTGITSPNINPATPSWTARCPGCNEQVSAGTPHGVACGCGSLTVQRYTFTVR